MTYDGDVENYDRERGILTPANRKFITGETTYQSEQSKRDARYTIRKRLYHSILDLWFINHVLHKDDIESVIDKIDPINKAEIVRFESTFAKGNGISDCECRDIDVPSEHDTNIEKEELEIIVELLKAGQADDCISILEHKIDQIEE